MRWVVLGFLALLLGVAGWVGVDRGVITLPLTTPDVASLVARLQQQGEVLTPPPLRLPLGLPGGVLTAPGVLTETNRQRAAEGLAALGGDELLDRAAQRKLDDMFAHQYFEHVAPDGTGPADLVAGVQYEYVRVGENLALGSFRDDATLVQAWMDSPGHRANILHTGFTELGVAVGQGVFEGQRTWLAVQTFALPLSACPEVDGALRQRLERQVTDGTEREASLARERAALDERQAELATVVARLDDLTQRGQQKIRDGNAAIERGNELYEETGDREQAEPHWKRGQELQAEGQALLNEAESLRKSYNEQVATYEQQRHAYNEAVSGYEGTVQSARSLAHTVNQQIRAFNACLDAS